MNMGIELKRSHEIDSTQPFSHVKIDLNLKLLSKLGCSSRLMFPAEGVWMAASRLVGITPVLSKCKVQCVDEMR
jgi:hypothetical protein